MADRLERMLRPGERVVYRTRHHWRRALVESVITAAFIAALFLIAWYLGAGPMVLVLMPVAPPVAFLQAYSTEVAVTDRRLLYRQGPIRRRFRIRRLANIAAIEQIGHPLVLRHSSGAAIKLARVPAPNALAAAITAETGLAGPDARARKADRWNEYCRAMGIAGAGLVIFSLIPVVHSVDYSALPQWLGQVPAAVAVGLTLAVLLLLVSLGILLGLAIGLTTAMAVVRLGLSVDEARLLFADAEWQKGGKWLNPNRPARRFASWLYDGQV